MRPTLAPATPARSTYLDSADQNSHPNQAKRGPHLPAYTGPVHRPRASIRIRILRRPPLPHLEYIPNIATRNMPASCHMQHEAAPTSRQNVFVAICTWTRAVNSQYNCRLKLCESIYHHAIYPPPPLHSPGTSRHPLTIQHAAADRNQLAGHFAIVDITNYIDLKAHQLLN